MRRIPHHGSCSNPPRAMRRQYAATGFVGFRDGNAEREVGPILAVGRAGSVRRRWSTSRAGDRASPNLLVEVMSSGRGGAPGRSGTPPVGMDGPNFRAAAQRSIVQPTSGKDRSLKLQENRPSLQHLRREWPWELPLLRRRAHRRKQYLNRRQQREAAGVISPAASLL